MKLSREQGDTKYYLWSTKIYLGSVKKIIQGGGRKGSNFKGSQELGTPLTGSRKHDKTQNFIVAHVSTKIATTISSHISTVHRMIHCTIHEV